MGKEFLIFQSEDGFLHVAGCGRCDRWREPEEIQKGKGILSIKGEKLAKSYLKDITEIKSWLKSISNFSDAEAYHEALTLVLVLSNKTRYKLITDLYKKKLFEKIDKVKSMGLNFRDED